MTTPLRKQKDEEKKERTRSKLLDAAALVFSESGFHRTLISDIVASAGVGQGTFYRYFTSKQQIFEALFDRLSSQLLEEFLPMSAHLPDNLSDYRAGSIGLLTRLASVFEKNRDLVLMFLRQGPSIDPEVEQRMAATYDRVAGLAKFYLDHAIEKGFARSCRSDLVAQALIGMGLRLIDLWLDDRIPSPSVDSLIEELVDFAFLGFGSSHPEHASAETN